MKINKKMLGAIAMSLIVTQAACLTSTIKAYGANEVTISSPKVNYKVTEDYIVRFKMPITIKPTKITISYTKTDGTLAKKDVTPKADGNYSELIQDLMVGENKITVDAEVGTTKYSSSVNVNVVEAITDITFDEENKGPFASDKNQFKNLLRIKNREVSLAQNKEPKSDAYINYFIDTLFNEAIKERIRPDVVFSQIMLETGWLSYTGDVSETQYNYGGIGATGNGTKGNAFSNIEEGIRVNVQHLFAYATDGTLKGEIVDPRFKYLSTKRGLTPKVEYLGYYENTNSIGWAVADQYGFKILDLIREIMATPNTAFEVKPSEKSVITSMDLTYVDINGISTTINQNTASIGSNLRVAISTNDLTKQKYKITNVKTKKVIETEFLSDYEYIFTLNEAGEYIVEAFITPLYGNGSIVNTMKKEFIVGDKVIDKASTVPANQNSSNTSNTAPIINNNNPVPGGQYQVTSPINVYGTAQDAINGVNPAKQYEAGIYYVFKTYNGMVNISKVKGTAGAWINPNAKTTTNTATTPVTTSSVTMATTSPKTIATTKATTPMTEASTTSQNYTVGGTFVLNGSINKYVNAIDAKNNTNAVGTYSAGTYYIYKMYDGMLNISKTPGIAGGWVNPKNINTSVTQPIVQPTTKATTTAKSTSGNVNYVVDGTINIVRSLNTYATALDALNHTNQKSTLTEGTYFIYKTYNGMVNVTKFKGQVGAWINPNDNIAYTTRSAFSSLSITPFFNNLSTIATTTSTMAKEVITTTIENEEPTTTTQDESIHNTYDVVKTINIYGTAYDAMNMVNPIKTYEAGTYNKIKEFNGMINISTGDYVGGWINPSENQ